MATEVHWLEEPHILAIHFTGDVGIPDMRAAIHAALDALDNGPVHFLLDFSQMASFDPNIMQLSSLSEWLYNPKSRWFAYVGLTGLSKNLMRLRHQNNIRFFQERSEAERFLHQVVQGIPNQ